MFFCSDVEARSAWVFDPTETRGLPCAALGETCGQPFGKVGDHCRTKGVAAKGKRIQAKSETAKPSL